jgi:hypothetical protein
MFQQQQQQQQQQHCCSLLSSSPPPTMLKDDAKIINSINTNIDKRQSNGHHVRRWSDIPTRSAVHNTEVFETILKDPKPRRRTHNTSLFHTFLRGNNNKQHPDNDDSSAETNNTATATVKFNTVVSVIHIPSRHQFSKRIKQSLWRDRYELNEMVERNMEEFAAENYDWRCVVLDDEMYVDSTNGELIHPIHVDPSGWGGPKEGQSKEEKKESSLCCKDDSSDDDDYDDDTSFVPLTRANSLPTFM